MLRAGGCQRGADATCLGAEPLRWSDDPRDVSCMANDHDSKEAHERSRVEHEVAEHRRLAHNLPFKQSDVQALRAMLAALVESSDDAIVAKDLEGTILAWNPAAERIFGWREDEVSASRS